MDEQVLLIAFAAFVVIVLVIAFVLRSTMVDDIFSDESPSFSVIDSPLTDRVKRSALPTAKSTSSMGNMQQRKVTFALNRQNLSALGKILAAVGTVMIIAPLPYSLEGLSFGIAFIGYILTRLTAPPKTQKTGTARNSTVDNLRQLASKPEYRDAMQILVADIADKRNETDVAQQRRAISYLQSKGVSKNVALLARIGSQQAKK